MRNANKTNYLNKILIYYSISMLSVIAWIFWGLFGSPALQDSQWVNDVIRTVLTVGIVVGIVGAPFSIHID